MLLTLIFSGAIALGTGSLHAFQWGGGGGGGSGSSVAIDPHEAKG